MKTLLLLGIIFLPFVYFAQESNEQSKDYKKVETAVISWADSTFFNYDEPRFEHYRANYTDEYLMASLRVKSIERSIRDLKKRYSSGYYNGSNEDYKESLEDLEKRLEEANEINSNFQPKAENYQIAFWANIKLDSGIFNYIKHNMVLDNEFKVIQHEISGSIGDKENANIIYR